jgi:hypothetical protein
MTESDGYFSYLGLGPGSYTARIDTAQLHKLKMSASPVTKAFKVKASIDGDVADGIEFIIKPDQTKTTDKVATPVYAGTESVTVLKKQKTSSEKISKKEIESVKQKADNITGEKKQAGTLIEKAAGNKSNLPEAPSALSPAQREDISANNKQVQKSSLKEHLLTKANSNTANPLGTPEKETKLTGKISATVYAGKSSATGSDKISEKEIKSVKPKPDNSSEEKKQAPETLTETGAGDKSNFSQATSAPNSENKEGSFVNKQQVQKSTLKEPRAPAAYPKSTPPAPTPDKVTNAVGFAILVGPYKYNSEASEIKERLAGLCSNELSTICEGDYYTILISFFNERSAAEKLIEELKKKGFPDPRIIRFQKVATREVL